MEKFYTIRKYCKIFEDEGKHYFFNAPKYMEILLKEKYSAREITEITERNISNHDLLKSERTIARMRQFSEGTDWSVKIDTIKLVGAALFQDEYAFLEPIDLERLAEVIVGAENKDVDNLKAIYSMMQKILMEYELSYAYNYIPGTTEMKGFEYYDKEITKIHGEILSRLVGNEEYQKRLCKLLDELEEFVKSYSVPGVHPRWSQISPEIKYYDAVYDFLDVIEKKEDAIKWFSFVPTQKEIEERQKYFEKINKENVTKNLQYSEQRIFQNQLLETFNQVFVYDFPEIKNK